MEKSFGIFAWIKNALSPALAGTIAALAIWHNTEAFVFKALAIVAVIAGITGGVVLAEWIRKKYGSENFIAESTPDLEKEDTKN